MKDVLELDPEISFELSEQCRQIRDAESAIFHYINHDTLTSEELRMPFCKRYNERLKLRARIVDELINLPRLEDDNQIRLGQGGIALESGFAQERTLYLITGLPASGKSNIASTIALKSGAAIVDSDYAKRKLPEFQPAYGASIVHNEAQQITEGILWNANLKEPTVLGKIMDDGYNVVLPKIGSNPESLNSIIKYFKDHDYYVYLIHIEVSPATAVKRAFKRFSESGRYIPLGLIYDGFGLEPLVAFFVLRDKDRRKKKKQLSGYIHLSNEGESGRKVIEQRNCHIISTWLTSTSDMK